LLTAMASGASTRTFRTNHSEFDIQLASSLRPAQRTNGRSLRSALARSAAGAESSGVERGRRLQIGHAFPRGSCGRGHRPFGNLTGVKRRWLLSGGIGDDLERPETRAGWCFALAQIQRP